MNEAIFAAICEAVKNGEEDALTRATAAVLRVHAKRDGDADAIKLLLQGPHVAVKAIREASLDPNVPDCDGKTPLHHAAESGNGDFVDALHDAGADLDARDIEGNSPPVPCRPRSLRQDR